MQKKKRINNCVGFTVSTQTPEEEYKDSLQKVQKENYQHAITGLAWPQKQLGAGVQVQMPWRQ